MCPRNRSGGSLRITVNTILRNAVVLSPAPHEIERLTPGSNGSWQHLHPPPDPALRGEVFFVGRDADLAALRRALPDRDYYQLVHDAKTRRFEVRPLVSGR